MGKDERLHLRLDTEARKKLLRACELTGLDEATALRACVSAFIEYVEENGGIWLPLAILPKSTVKKSLPPSTDSTRFSINEDSPAPKPAGPHPRSTRPGVQKTVARETQKP